jgi:hypothetical protein
MNNSMQETKGGNILKKLTQKIDALLAAKYSTTWESFTIIRSKTEFIKRAPWLV